MNTVTENLHKSAQGIDSRPTNEIAALLAEGQEAAARTAQDALGDICDGAEKMAATIQNRGSLIYAAAGSSALMALADALELGGTFGIEPNQIKILMAGGIPTTAEMPGDTEDETDTLDHDLKDVGPTDTLIAVSASGNTPFTLEAAIRAKKAGSSVISITNNTGTDLQSTSDCTVILQTPPELVSGSTRMGAATAQKIALNMMSTLMAIHLGHIHDGMMVNLKADNIKLRKRANTVVKTIADTSESEAGTALETAKGNVKIATLLAAGASSIEIAQQILGEGSGRLRTALELLNARSKT